MIFQLLWFIDLCLDSNSVFGHLIASVTYKNSNQTYRHMVHAAFHIPKIVYIFFLFLLLPLSPLFPWSPHFLHLLAFVSFALFFILLSYFWLSSSPLLCPFLSYCLFFLRFHSSLTPPPDWFLCLSIFSSNATRAASLPVAFGAASVYTQMMRLQTGKSRKSWVQMAPKRVSSAWWQGIATALHVIIW